MTGDVLKYFKKFPYEDLHGFFYILRVGRFLFEVLDEELNVCSLFLDEGGNYTFIGDFNEYQLNLFLKDFGIKEVPIKTKEVSYSVHWDGVPYAEGHPYYHEDYSELVTEYFCGYCGYEFEFEDEIQDYCPRCGSKVRKDFLDE